MSKKYTTDEIHIGGHSLDAPRMVQIDDLIAGGLHSEAGYLLNTTNLSGTNTGDQDLSSYLLSASVTRAYIHGKLFSTAGDADLYTEFGVYRNHGVNGPSGTAHNTLLQVSEQDGDYGFQLAADTSSGSLHYRTKGTTFGSWNTLASESFVTSQGYTGDQDLTGYLLNTTDTLNGDLSVSGYLQATSYLYLRDSTRILNKVGDGWLTFGLRNTSASEAVYDLANIGTISTSGNITANGTILTGDQDLSGYLTSINNSNWSGTQLAIVNGGTSSTTAAGARTNLGLGTAALSAATDFVSRSGDSFGGVLLLNQNPVGTTYGNGASETPTTMIQQTVGDNDGWRLYGETPVSNDVKMIFEIVDDIEGGDTWVFRNKKTYSPYTANDVVKIGGEGNITTSGKVLIGTVDANTSSTTALVLNGTEVEKRTLGSNAFNSTAFTTLAIGTTAITAMAGNTLSAQDKTDIGNLSGTNTGDQDLSGYSLSHTHPYLPLTGGTLTGNLQIDTTGGSSALSITGTYPTISLLDDDGTNDDFYIHVNSNNFYILANRTDNENSVGTSWESPHPLRLEADTNKGYLFDVEMINTNDSRLSNARTPLTHSHSEYVETSEVFSNSTEYPFKAIKLTGSGIGNSYDERVILLIPISETNGSYHNKISGSITASKIGGNVWDVFHIDAQSVYNTTHATFTSTGQRTGHKFVTCDYGGVTWLAIKPQYTANPYNNFWFRGQHFAWLDVNGDALKVISYTDNQSGVTVLNAEINNSIADYSGNVNHTINGNTIYNAVNHTSGTAASNWTAGNDARLSDARTPTAHTHPYSDLTGTVPTWNQNTSGNSATATEAQNNYFYVRGTSPSTLYVDTDQGETRYVHHNGGSIGFLGSGGSWRLRVAQSESQFYTSLIATNLSGTNTGDQTSVTGNAGSVGGYALNRLVSGGSTKKSSQVSAFANVSEVSGFYYGNNMTGAPTTDWCNYIHSSGNSWSMNYSFQLTHAFHSDNLWVSRTTNGAQSAARLILDSGSSDQTKVGTLQSNRSIRAPIFYDSDDTNYYVNPRSTSRFSLIDTNDIEVTGQAFFTDECHIASGGQILLDAASNGMYVNSDITFNSGKYIKYSTTHHFTPRDTSGNMHLKATAGGMYFDSPFHLFRDTANYAQTFRVDAGIGTASASLRAPIFYDSNDTGYYANMSSTSIFNDLRADIFYDKDNTSYYMRPGSTSVFNDLRANIFYSRSNTSFYCDPESTSKLNRTEFIGSTTPITIKVNSGYKSWVHHISSADEYVFAPSTADGGTTWDWGNEIKMSTLSVITAKNFQLTSDVRLKENIKPISDNKVNVKWKSFNFKGQNDARVGVIAQELEEAHPEFVDTDSKGFKSVKYIDLLISKIAELEARLEKAGI